MENLMLHKKINRASGGKGGGGDVQIQSET